MNAIFFFAFSTTLFCYTLKKMSPGALPFHPSTPATSFNHMYTSPSDLMPTPTLSDDLSSVSGSFGSGLTTPSNDVLLSPVHLTYGGGTSLGRSTTQLAYDPGAYNRLMHQYCALEEQLRAEKEEHNALKYVTWFIMC
jgi:hypothetical protein